MLLSVARAAQTVRHGAARPLHNAVAAAIARPARSCPRHRLLAVAPAAARQLHAAITCYRPVGPTEEGKEQVETGRKEEEEEENGKGPLFAFPDTGRNVLELLDGFRKSQVLFTAVELGVLDFLEQERACAEDVANGLGLSLDGTTRLLQACKAMGLVRKQKNSVIYENTTLTRKHLLSTSKDSFVGYIKHSLHVLYPLWGNLKTGVETGSNVWTETFNAKPSEVFENIYKTPRDVERFLAGMHSMGSLSSPRVVSAFDLSSRRVALDVAGGTGHLAIAFCQAYPGGRAAVGDLPSVLPVTQQYVGAAGLSDRVGTLEVDMFDSVPSRVPTATGDGGDGVDGGDEVDLIMLSRILHDWSDGQCAGILANCFHALPPGGQVLIAEMLLPDDGGAEVGGRGVASKGPVEGGNEGEESSGESAMVPLQSLNMLVQTHGKERTAREFEALLTAAGFVDVQTKRTGVYLDAITAVKPDHP